MKISLIIPTINRQKELQQLLDSAQNLSCQPAEIIIVEQGSIHKTEKILNKILLPNVKLVYTQKTSAAHARNLGASHASGDVLLFVDDDMIFDSSYICVLQKLLSQYPDTQIFTGPFGIHTNQHWIHKISKLPMKIAGLLFCSWKPFVKTNILLRSGHNMLKTHTITSPTFAQWASGANLAVKKDVFESGIKFYEGFTRYSLGEDVLFTYLTFKKYGPKAILIHPELKISHSHSQQNKPPDLVILKMRIIYKYILWKKTVSHKPFALTCYILSEILFGPYYAFKAPGLVRAIKITLKTYMYLIKNHNRIINEQINYNKFILDETF